LESKESKSELIDLARLYAKMYLMREFRRASEAMGNNLEATSVGKSRLRKGDEGYDQAPKLEKNTGRELLAKLQDNAGADDHGQDTAKKRRGEKWGIVAAGAVGLGVSAAAVQGIVTSIDNHSRSSDVSTVSESKSCNAPRLGDNEPAMIWDQLIRPGREEARDLYKQGYCVDEVTGRADERLGVRTFAKITEGKCDKVEVPVTEAEFSSPDPYDVGVKHLYVPGKRVEKKETYVDGTETGKRYQVVEPLTTKEEFRKEYNC